MLLLLLENKCYKPHQVVRIMEEEFGHRVTASVIRKWDNMILSKVSKSQRKKSEARSYSANDVRIFSGIAVLRSLGYSIEDTRQIIDNLLTGKGDKTTIVQIRGYIEKQIKGLDQLKSLMGSKLHE